jgi:hypothetical protein
MQRENRDYCCVFFYVFVKLVSQFKETKEIGLFGKSAEDNRRLPEVESGPLNSSSLLKPEINLCNI